MVSIIICSRNKNVDSILSENIANTIGKDIEYELIWIDNSSNQFNIFQAYQEGVSQAKYESLCFMHEDVLFHSKDWAKVINDIFNEEPEVGMIGSIGTHYMSPYSTYWMSSGICHGRIIQGDTVNGKHTQEEWNWNKTDKYSPYVVAIDGLWMVIRKSIFDEGKIFWDTKTYDGFHFYDMDISLQVLSAGYKIKIADDILIEHTSTSKMNRAFTKACVAFHEKWHAYFPIQSEKIDKADIVAYEKREIFNRCNSHDIMCEQNNMLEHPLHKFVTKLLNLIKK